MKGVRATLFNKNTLGWAVLATWLGLSTLLMYRFVFDNYGEFDPNQQWLSNQATPPLTALGFAASSGVTLIEVRQAGCGCNSYLDSHLASLRQSLGKRAFNEHQLSVQEVVAAGIDVPATPMALVYDGNTLVYAGPFASGPFCAADDSLIENLLRRETRLAGVFFNGQVKACRCLVQNG